MEARRLFSRFKIDLLLISPSATLTKRISQLGEKYHLQKSCVATVDEFEQSFSEIGIPKIILLDFSDLSQTQALPRLHSVQSMLPKSKIVVLTDEDAKPDLIQAYKDAGALWLVSQKDVAETVHLDFMLLQNFLLEYLPIDLKDLFPGTEINFNAFHFMRLNNKFLRVIFEDAPLSDKKVKRLEKVKSIFIHKKDAPEYQKYIETYYDQFKAGLQKRIKASFLHLLVSYSELKNHLVFTEGDSATEKILILMGVIEESFGNLSTYLKSTLDPLLSFQQNFSQNPYFSFDRSLAVSAFGAYLAQVSELADPFDVLKAGLLSSTGIFSLDYMSYLKWLESPEEAWTPEELTKFASAGILSLDIVRAKLGSVDQKTEMIISTYLERFDGKGEPQQLSGQNVPAETYLLKIADTWFRKLQIDVDMSSDQVFESFKQVLIEEKAKGRIDPVIIDKISGIFAAPKD